MESKKLCLSIDSDLRQVLMVGKTIRCLSEDIALANVNESQIELAVVEAINNSIEHAYSCNKGHKIEVNFELKKEVLSVTISDYGIPMSPEVVKLFMNDNVDMPEITTELDSLPEGGWGIQLVKSLCDSMSYDRKSTCNKLFLTFDLAKAAA